MGWTTVRMRDGLGNQLFQYAAGRALADRTRTRLRLDACQFSPDYEREFLLERFRIAATIVREPAWSAAYRGDDLVEDGWVRGRYGAETVREPHYHYSDVLETAGPNSYITGSWQSPLYFRGAEPRLRKELRPKRLRRRAKAIRSAIGRTPQSVAVHVRRGDTAENPELKRLFGSTPLEYYEAAAALIAKHRDRPRYFVFSDDPAWCERNLELPGGFEIVSGSTDAVEDLALIAACDDAIIANSSFSWWGAWLGESPWSIVVAPARWHDELETDTSDVVPDRWHLL